MDPGPVHQELQSSLVAGKPDARSDEEEEDPDDAEGDKRVALAIKHGYIFPSTHFTRSDGVGASMNRLRTAAIRAGAEPEDVEGKPAYPDGMSDCFLVASC